MPSSKGLVAKRYAEALFDLALSNGLPCAEKWANDLQRVVDTLGDEQFYRYLESPKVPFTKKRDLLNRAFGPVVDREVLNLFLLLVQGHKVSSVMPVNDEYLELLKQYKGIVTAYVTTAIPLPEDIKRKISIRLGSILGKTVELNTQVNPDIIGGLVIKLGDRLIDGSVATRLARLRDSLT